jgi:beta-glucosidase-like glycosyl hydrolase
VARLILGFRDAEPSAALRAAIGRGEIAGLLWFREALGASVREARSRVERMRRLWPPGEPCLFAIDEEGGLIQQLDGLTDASGVAWPRLPAPRALGRARDGAAAFAHGREIGRRLRETGIDVALAPLVDLDPGPQGPVLGTRCFGGDPIQVSALAMGWLRGLASAGVRGCVKHFPGHGATSLDSHRSLPRIDPTVDAAPHRLPFERIARDWRAAAAGPPPALLTAHIVPAGSSVPVTLDRAALRSIPEGFGPVWTDSLDMDALRPHGDLAQRGRSALEAGCDLLVVGADTEGGLAAAPTLRAPASSGVIAWMRQAFPPQETPEPWSLDAITALAAEGLRVLQEGTLPVGDWEWILPEDAGAYGAVREPAQDRSGVRRIARVIRVPRDPDRLAAALSGARAPALVGWIHRGAPDPATREVLERHAAKIGALAHLLDAPAAACVPGVWTVETCGFGEGEIAALARVWSTAETRGFAD